MTGHDAIGLVERARALQPLIAAHADEAERTRRLAQPVVDAMIDNGLYRSLLPRSIGGAESSLLTQIGMLEEVAKADASTAWCLGQCSVCAMTAAYLDPDAAREIFNTPPGILAWGTVANEVRAEPGGYRATARWEFASGSRQASWLGAHVRVIEPDGSLRRKADGSPEIRTILFPASRATLHDVWDVIGLKGTGTDAYSVEDLFVPGRFAALRDDPDARREAGPLYRIPTHFVFAMGFAGLSLGLARAMLDATVELARGKASVGIAPMRENHSVQGSIGRLEADLRAARAYLYGTAETVWSHLVAGGGMGETQRVAMRLASTWTIHRAMSVVDSAYHMAGATAVFRANGFERRFRDMHAIAQQIQARAANFEDAGRSILNNGSGQPT